MPLERLRLAVLALALVALGAVGCGGSTYQPLRMPPTLTTARLDAGAPRPEVERTVDSFLGARGTHLFERAWLPRTAPAARVIVVHGLRDHSARYDDFAERLVQEGFAVHAFDLRGHGRSEGERVWVDEFDDYVEDVRIFFDRVAAGEPKAPIFVLGYSMGGAIVARFALAHPERPRGIILGSGALTADVPWVKIAGTKTIAWIAPHAPIFSLNVDDFSRDPRVVHFGKIDPLVYQDAAPAHTARELLWAIDGIEQNEARLTVPVLLLHGTADKVTSPDGSRALEAKATSRDKTLRLYPGLYHDLLHEPEKRAVMDDVVVWLKARTQAP